MAVEVKIAAPGLLMRMAENFEQAYTPYVDQKIDLEAFARQPASTFQLETAGDEMLPAAVVAAVAYADLFDYPLTLDELARYQIGTRLSRAQIAGLLAA